MDIRIGRLVRGIGIQAFVIVSVMGTETVFAGHVPVVRPAAQIGSGKKLGLHGQLQSGGILPRPPGIRIQSIVVRRTATAAAGDDRL